MRNALRILNFTFEARDRLGPIHSLRAYCLQGNLRTQSQILSLIHIAHATWGNESNNSKSIGQFLARLQPGAPSCFAAGTPMEPWGKCAGIRQPLDRRKQLGVAGAGLLEE
jgi:hypothetical protein